MTYIIKILYPVYFILLLLSSSCETKQNKDLTKIETLINQDSDSAIIFLNDIDTSCLTIRDLNIYHVLFSEVRYKVGYDDTCNYNIMAAAKYFDKDLETPYRTKAWYYNAIIEMNRGHYGNALISLNKAEKSALAQNNVQQLALIHRAQGDAFELSYNKNYAIYYFQKSLKEFETTKEGIKYIGDTHYDLSRTYYNIGSYDSCIFHARKAAELASENEKERLEYLSYIIIGQAYKENKDYSSAIKYLEKVRKEFPDKMTSLCWNDLGVAYLKTEEFGNAFLCEDSLTASDTPNVELLSLASTARGDFKKAYELRKDTEALNDSIYHLWLTRSQEKTLYDNYLLSQKELETEIFHRNILLFSALLTSMIFILILIFVIKRIRRIRQERDEKMESVLQLRADIDKANSYLTIANNEINDKTIIVEGLQHEIKKLKQTQSNDNLTNKKETTEKNEDSTLKVELISNQFKILDILVGKYHDIQGRASEKKDIYEETMKIISSVRKNGKLIDNFEKDINKYLDNIIKRFTSDFPSISQEEKHLFIFIILGFSGKTISVIQDIPFDRVYNRKRSLKNKINSSSCPNKDIYLRYF